MKNYIAIGIMISLQSGKRYSAKELAEKFETSVKTIYRTIETLLLAGMPIISIQGKNGGYELMNEAKINSSFFTTEELCSFIAFISSNKDKYNQFSIPLEERLTNKFNEQKISEIKSLCQQLVIDTNLWGHNEQNKEKTSEFKKFIFQKQKIKIDYINIKENKIEERIIHPYTLVYKSNTWYIYAFCEKKNSFRLFKLSRINNFKKINENFEIKNLDILSKPWNKDFESNLEKIEIELACKPFILCDIKDWLGDNMISYNQIDSNLIKVSAFANYSLGLVHKIIEFGNNVKILKPQKLKESLQNECLTLYNLYQAKSAFC